MAYTNLLCFALVLIIVLGQYWASQASARPLVNALTTTEKYEQWLARHGLVFKDDIEKEKRFKIFKEILQRILDFNQNAANNSYTLGVNAFAVLTNEEFLATHTGYKTQFSSQPSITSTFRYENFTDMAPSMDWRQMGAVTEIKYQGECGSCWAFSAVAAVEGLNKIKTTQLISLSEQEVIDCNEEHYGCGGGDKNAAFDFIQQNQGLAREVEYQYKGFQDYCQASTVQSVSMISINGYQQVPQNDEVALMQAVSQQPVSVGVDATNFKDYNAGVFDGPCGTDLNHAVTVVGYGTDETTGTDYWLIKNSWGTSWGENGYMRILRGQNLCGIAMHASYPIS